MLRLQRIVSNMALLLCSEWPPCTEACTCQDNCINCVSKEDSEGDDDSYDDTDDDENDN